MSTSHRALISVVTAACAVLPACGHAQAATSPTSQTPWPDSYLRRTGEVQVPVLLARFKDAPSFPAPFSPSELEEHFFTDTGASRSLSDYFREVSYGQFLLRGAVHGWFDLSGDYEDYYLDADCLGICLEADGEIAQLIEDTVHAAQAAGVDFSVYDSDGPDGLPDSGDDDGFVDLLVVTHSEPGSGCQAADGTRSPGITAHEQKIWNLFDPPQYLDTHSPRDDGGGPILVNEFIIVPGRGCRERELPPIGTYAHEIGHALGLPDLVDQDQSSGGIGYWSLMAEGGAGGDGFSPHIPVHLSAWAKERLGWLVPRPLGAGDRDRLKPVETHPDAIRLPLDNATDQYYLLEVRHRTGFDRNLPGPGLLVWRINQAAVDDWDEARRANIDQASVNDDDARKGVVLIEADGRGDLASETFLHACDCLGLPGCAGRCDVCCGIGGDAGDAFPGRRAATSFDSESRPRNFARVALCDIEHVDDEVLFRLDDDNSCD